MNGGEGFDDVGDSPVVLNAPPLVNENDGLKRPEREGRQMVVLEASQRHRQVLESLDGHVITRHPTKKPSDETRIKDDEDGDEEPGLDQLPFSSLFSSIFA